MAIEIIDTLGQKNNGDFPLVDSNDIKGGYYQVDTAEERDSIPSIRRKEGMLCYVKNDKIYQLANGIENDSWIEFVVGSDFDGDYESLTNKPNIPSVEGLATKEQVEELKSTLEEHLENHPSGSSEFATDYGVLCSDVQIIHPIEISDETFIAYRKNNGGGVFSTAFKVNESDIELNNYYYKNNMVEWDFSNSQYHSRAVIELSYTIEEIYTNNQTIYDTLIDYGYKNVVSIDDNALIHIQQIRGDSKAIDKIVGKQGQLVVNTDDNTIHVMDGTTIGGTKLATEKFVQENILEVDLSGYYSKEEVDAKIEEIECESVDLSNYYTKEEVEEKLEQIDCEDVDLTNYFTKEEINNLLKDLPSQSDGYSKEEIDNMLKDVPKLLEDIDTILTYIVGCDHSEEIALLDIINGEVI